MHRTIASLSALLLSCAMPQGDRSTPVALVLSGARVLDETGESWLEGHDVVVSGGRITRIGPASAGNVPADTPGIDLTGLYLVPGLIDLHSHLLLHPYDETKWTDQVLLEPLELRTIRATVAARKTIERPSHEKNGPPL